ncbi:hypothetical protein ScPMuIL_014895 [Solemya velum]
MTYVLMVCFLLAFYHGNAKEDMMIKTALVDCGKVPLYPEATNLAKCKMRLDIDLKITSIKQVKTDTQYISVERVFDSVLQREVRLFTPILIKIWQENVTLVYPLETVAVVNNKAYEVVIHKDNVENYLGCKDDVSQTSMCGHHVQDGNPVSHGFCCHCDNSFQNQPYHTRGGQDCSDEYIARGTEAQDYLSSAHCLRFDPVWYSVKDLKAPQIYHLVHVSVFVEEIDPNGKRNWVDIAGTNIGVGTHKTVDLSPNKKVLATYVQHGNRHPASAVNIRQKNLLIPQANPSALEDIPLQLKGSADEFLVLDRSDIVTSGVTCDKAGISYEAFISQMFRCSKPMQSCLDKQPMHYWLHDIERTIQKKRGKYFLGNFAEPASPALVQHVGESFEWLRLKYTGDYHAHIYLQLNAENILVLPRGQEASIEEIHFLSSLKDDTVMAYVRNTGRMAALFSVVLSSCDSSKIRRMKTKPVLIGPRESKNLDLVFNHVTPSYTHIGVVCHVMVLNSYNNTVAERSISFQFGEQCFCMGNCQCSCSSVDVRCSHGLEARSRKYGIFTSLSDFRFIICCVLMIMLIGGLLKAVFGLIAPVSIGQSGVSLFIEKQKLDKYYEKSLNEYSVLHNEDGIPIHPVTKKLVQRMPTWKVTLINIFFCFYFPFVWIHWLYLRKKHGKSNEFDWGDGKEKTSLLERPSLTQNEIDLAIEQYKKQKEELAKGQQLASASPKELATQTVSPDRNARRFLLKDSIQQLLKKEFVYYNYTSISPFLKNSSSKFSLCGKLQRDGRKYKFHLNGYDMQTHENENGIPKQLVEPRRIIHPAIFTQVMTISGAYQFVSERPEYPCLN